jgi:hypothetical protein
LANAAGDNTAKFDPRLGSLTDLYCIAVMDALEKTKFDPPGASEVT